MKKRILITAGGTGGHVYPAQGLAHQLLKKEEIEILFVAGGLASNRYFERNCFPFKEVACSPFLSRYPWKCAKGLYHLVKGISQSKQIIKSFDPHVVVGFGSYYTVSTVLAARMCQIPIILHEANSIPGKANKWFAPLVHTVGVHFPYTKSLLKGQSVEVGMPLREGYEYGFIAQEEARQLFNLDPHCPTLLVFGGSQGANSLNQMMKTCILKHHIPFEKNMQIIHLTGHESAVAELSQIYKENGIKACVKPFEKAMNYAWAAASCFLGRSGASTIAEALEFEVPGLLIPYPYATDNHQEKNADFLVNDVKGALKLLESQWTPEKVGSMLNQLWNEAKENSYRQAMRDYKTRPSRLDLCQLILNVIQ
jgi:UDP-N-acetylglucosamine--N-acetylmuramyl-(pentapeptide) pyrophosphoryl-undecaprenol N-acetylglucosamine transferase